MDFDDVFEFPLPFEVKRIVENVLKEDENDERLRPAILDSVKNQRFEFRLSSKQARSLNNLVEIVGISSKIVMKFKDHELIEGAILQSIHKKSDEKYYLEILFILSDLLLPKIEKKWREERTPDKPISCVLDEWEIFQDNKMPTKDVFLKNKIFHCLFVTPRIIWNIFKGPAGSERPILLWFQDGILLYDKKGIIRKLIDEVVSDASEDVFNYLKKKWYMRFEDLIWGLEGFLNRKDDLTAEIISVEAIQFLIKLMLTIDKKVSPQSSTKIMLAARKHLPYQRVKEVEKILLIHDLFERLRLLKVIRSSLAEGDEWMREHHKAMVNFMECKDVE